MSIELARAYVTIIPSMQGAQTTISKELGATDVDESGKKVGRRFGAAIGVGLALASAAVVKGVTAAVGASSDLNESVNAVNVSYAENADGILALSQNSANAVGLSSAAFNSLAVQFSAFSKTIAGDGGDVVGTLDSITGRASDFASVMNLEVADAATLFQSGLAGETEPLRRYGIDLSAAAVEAYAMSEGIWDGTGAMTEAQKVQARYGSLMAQTAATAGDFANTSGEYANQQRILAANTEDLSAKFGALLIPALTAATAVAIPFVQYLTDNQGALIAVASVVGALLVGAIVSWTTSMVTNNVELAKQAWALGVSTAAKVKDLAVGGALRTMYAVDMAKALAATIASNIRMAATWVASTASIVAHKVATTALSVATKAAAAAQWVMNAALTANPIGIIIALVAALVAGLIWFFTQTEIGQKIVEVAFAAIKTAVNAVVSWFTNTAVPWVKDAWAAISGAFQSGYQTVKGWLSKALDFIKAVWSYSPLGLVVKHWSSIIDWFKSLPGKIASGLGDLYTKITSPFVSAFNAVAGFWNSTVGSISFTVPDWVPGVGGNGWSLPKIPLLASGAVVTAATLALVGEGREPEAVMPLSKLDAMLTDARSGGSMDRDFADYLIRGIACVMGLESDRATAPIYDAMRDAPHAAGAM